MPCGPCKNRRYGGTYRLSSGLLVSANVVPSSLILFTLIMEEIVSPKRRILQATRCHISEDGILQNMAYEITLLLFTCVPPYLFLFFVFYAVRFMSKEKRPFGFPEVHVCGLFLRIASLYMIVALSSIFSAGQNSSQFYQRTVKSILVEFQHTAIRMRL
jgi:hypothetical protein